MTRVICGVQTCLQDNHQRYVQINGQLCAECDIVLRVQFTPAEQKIRKLFDSVPDVADKAVRLDDNRVA